MAALWWLRIYLALCAVDLWMIHDASPLVWLLSGILIGMALDRFVLLPLAVIIARLDGRFRAR